MKVLISKVSIISVALFLLAGCREQGITDLDKLLEQDGVAYQKNSRKPFTGIANNYWPNGEKKLEFHFRDGKVHGKTTHWFENGQLAYVIEWSNGKRNGKWIKWNESGQKVLDAEFREGEPHGKTINWNENGQKLQESEYRNGKQHGKTITWHENGKKNSEIEVSDGEEISRKEWDEDGNLHNQPLHSTMARDAGHGE